MRFHMGELDTISYGRTRYDFIWELGRVGDLVPSLSRTAFMEPFGHCSYHETISQIGVFDRVGYRR